MAAEMVLLTVLITHIAIGLGMEIGIAWGDLGFGLLYIFGRGDDTVGNPHRAEISQFQLFGLILLLKLDTVPRRATRADRASQSTVPSPLLYLYQCLSSCRHRLSTLALAQDVLGHGADNGQHCPAWLWGASIPNLDPCFISNGPPCEGAGRCALGVHAHAAPFSHSGA